jgi:hypothetical protein
LVVYELDVGDLGVQLPLECVSMLLWRLDHSEYKLDPCIVQQIKVLNKCGDNCFTSERRCDMMSGYCAILGLAVACL